MRRALKHAWLLLLGASGLFLGPGCGEIELDVAKQGKVGTFFFFWHDCTPNPERPNRHYPFSVGPDNACPQDRFPYHPVAMNGGKPFRYSGQSIEWYIDELQQMKQAGVDYIFPVYWGDHPGQPWFTTQTLALLVESIDRAGSDIKLGLFDDTSSQVSQWNWENGRDYKPSPAMNLADQSTWRYFFEGKIEPFFRTIPRRMWATHNGRSVEDGGRPIIITWIAKSDDQNPEGPSFFSYHGAAATLWHHLKDRFEQEFGVEPFVIFETSWYREADDLRGIGDAEYSWGAAAFHSIWYETAGYVVSSVGPGYDDHLERKTSPRVRGRNVTHDLQGNEQLGDGVAFFRNEYLMDQPLPNWPHHGVRKDSNLVLVETWNELYEGTALEEMVDWPDPQRPGRFLPPDTYIRALRELKRDRPGFRERDHTIVSTRRNADGTWTLEVRNDGTLLWKKGSGGLGYRIHDKDGKRKHEALLGQLERDVAFGETHAFTFAQPGEWTDQARYPFSAVLVDFQLDGEWFTDRGDGFLIRAILPVFPGFF